MKPPQVPDAASSYEAPDYFENAVADLVRAPKLRAAKAANIELLDGDEIIQLSIKPAIWFIPLVSLRIVATALAAAVIWAAALSSGVAVGAMWPIHVLVAVAASRLGIATLQWASRLYVLTNRRVLRFKGVVNVNADECRLTRIGGVTVSADWHERLLGIGSVAVHPAEDERHPVTWRCVAHPEEIRDMLIAAIRKSQRGGSA